MIATRTIAPVLLAFLLCGCGRYADFTLPAPEASGPSGPFAWTAQEQPVIDRGDAADVLNPAIVKYRGQYLNLYSSWDGKTWTTALASSPDGIAWRKQGAVLAPEGKEGKYIAANGSALAAADGIFYWYETGDPFSIALAWSTDGMHWTRKGAVLERGPRGSFDEVSVADPHVIRRGGRFYMFYLGMDRAHRQRLGVAQSQDAIRWEKLRTNPILELGAPGAFDEQGLGEPAVWSSGGSYWMLYTGRDRAEHRRLGLAKSPDGIHWERDSSLPPIAGSADWDRSVVCDPDVEVTPQGIRVWFGGGDVPRPDQNLHGQIGLGFLTPAIAGAR
jgi:predicted GH43/DUF377 family glycosyl hydrolase